MLDAGARCANHPQTPAYTICERCGTYACASCSVYRKDTTLCVACARRSPLGASWLAVASAGLGFVGIGCVPLAPFALVLGVVDLVRLAAGRAPKEGAKLDAIGVALSLVAAALWAMIVYRQVSAPGGGYPMFE